ncbi:MAG TPA: hypothetical protein VGJ20_19255 [Xanthobacteraceae bacterium]
MKILTTSAVGALLLVAIASPSLADDSGLVRRKKIVGIEQALNVVGNAPNTISGGGQPWSTLDGDAVVNLSEGSVDFEVRGLTLAGGNSIGTPDGVTNVVGTLLCGLMPGETTTVIDTNAVPLSAQGNAEFSGSFNSSTAGCSATDVAFFIRNASGTFPWIGNGAVRVP